MKNLIAILFVVCFSSTTMRGQELREILKSQSYLEIYYKRPFDCFSDPLPDNLINTMTDRICANLKLQRSDSIVSLYKDSVRAEIMKMHNDTLLSTFDIAHKSWLKYRVEHSKALNTYMGSNTAAEAYMNELRLLTDIRINELKTILNSYSKNEY